MTPTMMNTRAAPMQSASSCIPVTTANSITGPTQPHLAYLGAHKPVNPLRHERGASVLWNAHAIVSRALPWASSTISTSPGPPGLSTPVPGHLRSRSGPRAPVIVNTRTCDSTWRSIRASLLRSGPRFPDRQYAGACGSIRRSHEPCLIHRRIGRGCSLARHDRSLTHEEATCVGCVGNAEM